MVNILYLSLSLPKEDQCVETCNDGSLARQMYLLFRNTIIARVQHGISLIEIILAHYKDVKLEHSSVVTQ